MTTTDGSGPSTSTPRVVVVAGSGRSGTSTIAGVLKTVGLVIPPPEAPGNRTNPRGFFEPRWVVDVQTRLLRRSSAFLTDARPAAFDLAAAVADDDEVRAEVADWLQSTLRAVATSWSRTPATAGSSRCGSAPRPTPARRRRS